MTYLLRGLVGVAGALALAVAVRLWLAPEVAAGPLGLAAKNALGLATIRADLAGFFAAGGAFALAAAASGRGRLLSAPLLLVGLALAGRILTFAMGAHGAEMVPPMAVEAVLIAIFGAGRVLLARG